MNLLGITLHSPSPRDVLRSAILLALLLASCAVAKQVLGFSTATASVICMGAALGTIGSACGLDIRKHGVRGVLVLGLILVALVATMAGIHWVLGPS